MCNAIGLLQQSAEPAILPGHERLFSDHVKNENTDFKPKGAVDRSKECILVLDTVTATICSVAVVFETNYCVR